jgi:hypothetical protein
LAAASATNAHLEGDDVGTLDNPNLTTRLGNTCQILWKTGGVSRTQEIVDLAGRESELARQKVHEDPGNQAGFRDPRHRQLRRGAGKRRHHP